MQRVVASKTERVLEQIVAPEILSRAGKISILFIYALLISICAYGANAMKTLFSFDLYVTPDFSSYDYIKSKNDHFHVGWGPATFVQVEDEDFYAEKP